MSSNSSHINPIKYPGGVAVYERWGGGGGGGGIIQNMKCSKSATANIPLITRALHADANALL